MPSRRVATSAGSDLIGRAMTAGDAVVRDQNVYALEPSLDRERLMGPRLPAESRGKPKSRTAAGFTLEADCAAHQLDQLS
jgi:hypothetical protein